MTSAITRRQLLQQTGALLALPALAQDRHDQEASERQDEWIRHARILLAEAYDYPFYPAYSYSAEKALSIAQSINADAIRFPAASIYAYYATKTAYPIHPSLGSEDPLARTIELFHDAGMKVVAYLPVNHPFMHVDSNDPHFADWQKCDANGRPMITGHLGYAEYYEGCLNSPLQQVITEMAREVVSRYPVDVVYFDGPYQGMRNRRRFCHCRHCRHAYLQARGKPIPDQDEGAESQAIREYYLWMRDEVATALMRRLRDEIRAVRPVPVLYNGSPLLRRTTWSDGVYSVLDGFMFEAADTPEDKLFNLLLGKSTGKVIWTYVGHHTLYTRAHLKNKDVRGWMSYPVESEEPLLDGAIALTAGVGMIYWSMARFFGMPADPTSYPSGRYLKQTYDFAARYAEQFSALTSQPQAGILVSKSTIDWYRAAHFQEASYEDSYCGAWRLLKDLGYDAEPFLDQEMTAESLRRFKLVFVPYAACLSDRQCDMLAAYVNEGGVLVATHLTSVADETGKVRKEFGLAALLGANLISPEPVELPDLYLRTATGDLTPQDPQIVRFRAADAEIIAENLDRARDARLGPAMIRRKHGKGTVIYIGSSLETAYQETRMPVLRDYFRSIVDPVLSQSRTYEFLPRPGLMAHLVAGADRLVLHLLADTGTIARRLNVRNEFVPLNDVQVRIRLPEGRQAHSVSLLRSGGRTEWKAVPGWVETRVPRLFIHEAVEVRLGSIGR